MFILFSQEVAAGCLLIVSKITSSRRNLKLISITCAKKAAKNDNLEFSEDSKVFFIKKDCYKMERINNLLRTIHS